MNRTLTREQVLALAEHVEGAELNVHDIPKITNDYPQMTFADAYDIQWEIRRRKEARGNKTKAAELVGLPSYQTLTNWLKTYEVQG